MGKIISFATQKGGSGKSTLLMLLASGTYNRTKKKILVIDADPQQTVYAIARKEKPPFKVMPFDWYHSKAEDNFAILIDEAAEEYDVVFLDLPGKIGGEGVYLSILISDIVIVPLFPSVLDIQSTLDFLKAMPDIAKKRSRGGLDFQVFGIVNRKPRTVEHRDLDAINGMHGLELFEAGLSDRKRYRTDISLKHQITSSTDELDEYNQLFQEFSTKCL